tara:strand:- start:176 stop:721 length:546 start_codon:yes stop_codon:yes gene_type:complete
VLEKVFQLKILLKFVNKKNGHLYSIDVDDCSEISNSSKWTFIKSRDDDFENLKNKLPEQFDLIFLDSFHNAEHVCKIFYHYYSKLKKGGSFYFDDISWLPYLKNAERNNFNCEMNNLETFEKLVEIFSTNRKNMDLYFSFVGSGMAKIIKLNDQILTKQKKIKSRKFSLKNFVRKFYNYFL